MLRWCVRFVVVAVFIACAPPSHAADRVVVFAAASLKTALDGVNSAWKADTQKEAVISYAASSALARQIEAGAPADVFISADLDWMKYVQDQSLVSPGSEVRLLGNAIVLIAPKESAAAAKIAPGFPLGDLLGDGKLAMADVKAVPAGKYGKAALESLGVWSSVEARVVMAENVRAALKLVSTGEAALGIVYRSDAKPDEGVKVLDEFPANTHPPIIYPAAILATSQNPDAAAFLAFLQSKQAAELFEAQGFTMLVKSGN